MKGYETPYYIVYSDMEWVDVREAAVRMSRMAEEYHNRTREFAGEITEKMPFYLYQSADDYYAAGGLPGSDGCFDPSQKRLMAKGGEHANAWTWHIIQHEGFHQFANMVVRAPLPPWMNEGLAEYFGYGVFTGDSYVTGVIPAAQLRKVKAEMDLPADQGGFLPLPQMMLMSHNQWNSNLQGVNYDEAWSLIQFLAWGDGGKYQRPFVSMLLDMNHGMDWQQAWQTEFGGLTGFEDRWRKFWHDMPTNPTDLLYAEATVSTLTSFLARADESGQKMEGFSGFVEAADQGIVKIPEADWLPITLLNNQMKQAAARVRHGAKFSIEAPAYPSGAPAPAGALPTLVICEMPDGKKLVGSFTRRNDGHIDHVKVDAYLPVTGGN